MTSDLLLKVQTVDPGNNGDKGDNPGSDPGRDPGRDPGGDRDKTSPYDGRDGRQEPVSRWETSRIVKDLHSIRWECRNYDQIYRVDCLRQGLEMTVANMPDTPEYRDARRILKRASRQLAEIVSTYEDTQAPRLEVPKDANPRFRKKRTYRAIKQSALPKALARANAVVEEAATELLRSAENSEKRYAHYQQISSAVDSTKVLLRSG